MRTFFASVFIDASTTIELTAFTPLEAAQRGLSIFRDPGSRVRVFEAFGDRPAQEVDPSVLDVKHAVYMISLPSPPDSLTTGEVLHAVLHGDEAGLLSMESFLSMESGGYGVTLSWTNTPLDDPNIDYDTRQPGQLAALKARLAQEESRRR